ncbi:hypothetical protein [Streptomyces sp. NPDC001889]
MAGSSMPSPGGPGPERPARTAPTADGGARATVLIAFPLMGGILAWSGMAVTDVLTLLGGCGVIGAATFALAGGGRRLAGTLAAAAVRAAADK